MADDKAPQNAQDGAGAEIGPGQANTPWPSHLGDAGVRKAMQARLEQVSLSDDEWMRLRRMLRAILDIEANSTLSSDEKDRLVGEVCLGANPLKNRLTEAAMLKSHLDFLADSKNAQAYPGTLQGQQNSQMCITEQVYQMSEASHKLQSKPQPLTGVAADPMSGGPVEVSGPGQAAMLKYHMEYIADPKNWTVNTFVGHRVRTVEEHLAGDGADEPIIAPKKE